jgi:long-chain acyl-CoA synthetase
MSGKGPSTAIDILERNARVHGERLALDAGGKVFSFREFLKECLVLGGFLKSKGVGPGTRVAFFIKEYTPFFTGMFATWAAGGVVVPVNVSLPPRAREYIVRKAACGFVLKEGAGVDPEGPFTVIDLSEYQGDRSEPMSRVPVTAEDEAIILFTSGTTGVPRGAPFPHGRVQDNPSLVSEVFGLTMRDRIMINTPPYYTSAICHLLTLFSKGGGVVAESGFFFGEDLLEFMEEKHCTGFGGAPAHLTRMVETPDRRDSPLEFIVSSGDHLPEHTIQGIMSSFPRARLFCVYGLTEVAGRLCVLDPQYLPQKICSVGHPLPGMKISIRREDLSEADRGETGEVLVEGPLLMEGYLDEPELNRELLGPYGFRTGDYGYIDADGFLFLQGRRDDIFKCGGEKVSTFLIAKEVARCSEFKDFAILPVEDELLGKVSKIYYVPLDNRDLDRKALLKGLRESLPPTHIPRKFVRVSRIPRTGSGKIIRRDLDRFVLDSPSSGRRKLEE